MVVVNVLNNVESCLYMYKQNLVRFLLGLGVASPRYHPVTAVTTKAIEFVIGTAKVRSRTQTPMINKL